MCCHCHNHSPTATLAMAERTPCHARMHVLAANTPHTHCAALPQTAHTVHPEQCKLDYMPCTCSAAKEQQILCLLSKKEYP